MTHAFYKYLHYMLLNIFWTVPYCVDIEQKSTHTRVSSLHIIKTVGWLGAIPISIMIAIIIYHVFNSLYLLAAFVTIPVFTVLVLLAIFKNRLFYTSLAQLSTTDISTIQWSSTFLGDPCSYTDLDDLFLEEARCRLMTPMLVLLNRSAEADVLMLSSRSSGDCLILCCGNVKASRREEVVEKFKRLGIFLEHLDIPDAFPYMVRIPRMP